MRKKLIKVLVAFYLCVVFAFSFISCGKDDFVLIRSITYTTDGKTKTESSQSKDSYNEEVISWAEYNRAPESKRISCPDMVLLPADYKMPKQHEGKTSAIQRYDAFAQETRYWSKSLIGGEYFYKGTCVYTQYFYRYVKIIDTDTIVVKNGMGETTYKVTSYKILYFED